MTTPSVLGERYEIGGVLGRGGMAEVHRGRDLRLGREVAVKVLRQDLARDPSSQVRFRREAQAAASLNHPAIVAVYDTGEDRTANGATPYIVMEYVEGETLRDVLRREGRLSPDRAMSLTADICAALDFSHRNGIVHRDVKPGNVMITPQGTVKVMDFGIARAVSDSAATMTSTAAVIGTAQYLSPEQARGEGVDARSDVYSAGCLLYELVTGTPPFTGDSPVAVAYQHVREDPRTPSSINPEIPPELDAILLKAMSKNPANRYQSAADMRADLLRAVAGQRVEATPVMSDAEKTTIIGATPGGYGYAEDWDDDEQAARKKKRNRVIALVVGALVLIGGAVGIALALSQGDDDPPPVTQVAVPVIANSTQDEARAALARVGLEVGTVSTEASSTVPVDRVISSDPAAGTEVDEGTTVDLVVSAGPNTINVPQVVGLTRDRAVSNLQNAGFTGSISSEQVDSLEPEGQVVSIDPGEGTAAAPDASFTLGVSTGTVSIPADLVGKSPVEARAQLVALGIASSDITEVNAETADVAPGLVAGTQPGARSSVAAGDEVTLLVAVAVPVDTPTTSAPSTPPSSSAPPAPSSSPTTTTG
ncbi:Stk1 family PASTA domain-containing Ser/Thr kinase [Modestobacter versicolor]|uniref:non-specific serine/threonine protein kinase n=1 Tax=Modestobacter versicolor TaxID=429133 RepID=A0A323VEQ0_9ACTN|nr:Stk1 family PASTA domain-containing Ser/Thr kinase [Modestobacter versicolor]MBB3677334.1 serine/threonine-protein kinase [Modestobacter versicolor]PZA23302.1 Stk1 family PASTA domain-containing Ser/Thr kinase [Modestobacter versicolor]